LLQDQNTPQNKKLAIDTFSQSSTFNSNNIGHNLKKLRHKIPQLPPLLYTLDTQNMNDVISPTSFFTFESEYCHTKSIAMSS
jgi:hypothetical protein